jgi:hypothetical protein
MSETTVDKLSWIKPRDVSGHSPELSKILRDELSNIVKWKDLNKKFDKDSKDFNSEDLDFWNMTEDILSKDFSVGVTDQEFLSIDTEKFIDQRAGTPFNNKSQENSDTDIKIAMDREKLFSQISLKALIASPTLTSTFSKR